MRFILSSYYFSQTGPDSEMWSTGDWKSWRVNRWKSWLEGLWDLKLMQVEEEVL